MQTKSLIYTKFLYYTLDIVSCQRKWFPDETYLEQFLLSSEAAFD